MARPHIEYLQSQTIPWRPSPWPHLPGCLVKQLSRDTDTGAVSLLVRFPTNWSDERRGALAAAREWLVLDGVFDLDGQRWGPDCYGSMPAGCEHGTRSTPVGAVALVFYDRDPMAPAGAAQGPPPGPPVFVDAFEMPWEPGGEDPGRGGEGMRRKLLRGSTTENEATMLVATPPHLHPHQWQGPQESHQCVEEFFLLSGDCLTNLGQMWAGAYFWQPARVAHGPFGSRGGNLALIRSHGGPLMRDWTPHERKLPRAPEYQPVLPAELAPLRSHPWRPQQF